MRTDYFTVRKFCQKNSLSEGAVRAWIFNGKENGFDKCVRRLGRKIIISQDGYYEWMSGEELKNIPSASKKNLIKDYLELNKSILELGDNEIGKLFEDTRTTKEQRIFTRGIIEGLEATLDEEVLTEEIEILKSLLNENI
tara:strand:+ start:250 stop:669 length:420 start_codon:yes stop_codon:yes gene_type:complete